MQYISNAFSLSMLERTPARLYVAEIDVEKARDFVETYTVESAIGHESTAQIVSEILGIPIPAIRRMITLKQGDSLLVFQLLKRLPEGVVLSKEEIQQLPYKFFLVEIA